MIEINERLLSYVNSAGSRKEKKLQRNVRYELFDWDAREDNQLTHLINIAWTTKQMALSLSGFTHKSAGPWAKRAQKLHAWRFSPNAKLYSKIRKDPGEAKKLTQQDIQESPSEEKQPSMLWKVPLK